MSAWEALEDQLATLFAILCESGTTASSRAYGAAVAQGSRSDMLKAAGEIFFYRHQKRRKSEFDKLIEQIGKLAARRNEIAHGRLVNRHGQGKHLGYFLQPALYNSRKIHPIDYVIKYRYNANHIDAFKAAFDEYAEKVLFLKRSLFEPES